MRRAAESCIYGLFLLGVTVLAFTGVPGFFAGGTAGLSGNRLWVHVAATPLFIGMLLLIVLAWGERCRFGAMRDSSGARRTGGRSVPREESGAAGTPAGLPHAFRSFGTVAKAMFWAMAFSGFAAITSALLSMTPLFPSASLPTLLTIHRYSAVVLVAAAVVHAAALLLPSRPSTEVHV